MVQLRVPYHPCVVGPIQNTQRLSDMSNELLDEFIFDSRDHLSTAGAQLLDLEKNPDSLNALNALMGTMHTIKGNSGFLDLQNLYKLMHHAESLLQTVREKQCSCPQRMIDLLLQVLDTVEALLSRLENGDDDSVEWLGALNQALSEAETSLEREGEPEPVVQAASPAAAPAAREACAAQALSGPNPVVIDEDLTGRVDMVAIGDGQLADEGDMLPFKVEAMFQAGLSGLIIDLRGLSSVSGRELKSLMSAGKKNPEKTAFILDQKKQESLFRVFQVLHLDAFMHFFADPTRAKAYISDRAEPGPHV
ncbi:hypothetical protein C4J81_07740 [Deltaproteobacteria bacterium Smac51]|nr:hypothetical protein C4J81_07740 [Deltaproteobacteria bacterium Smac51]